MALKIYAIFTCNNRSWITRSVKVGKDNKIVRTGAEAEKETEQQPPVDEENPPQTQVEEAKEKSVESLNEIVVQ